MADQIPQYAPTLQDLSGQLQPDNGNALYRLARGVQNVFGNVGNDAYAGAPGLVSTEDVNPVDQIPKSKKDLAWLALTSGVGAALPMMIPTAKNLPIFQKKFDENLWNSPGINTRSITLEDVARAFMETRYPKRMGNVTEFQVDPSLTAQRAKGLAIPLVNPNVDRNKIVGTLVKYISNPEHAAANGIDPIADVVNTLGHETEHARQQRKIPVWAQFLDHALPYQQQFMENGNAAAWADPTNNKILPSGNAQPLSTGAWGAGDTAQQAYEKYLQLLAAARQNRNRR